MIYLPKARSQEKIYTEAVSFSPSEVPLRERNLGGSGGMLPPLNVFKFHPQNRWKCIKVLQTSTYIPAVQDNFST